MSKATVITFSNEKGGVGKTTSVAGVGCLLAEKGYKTLLINLDWQCNLEKRLSCKTDHNIYEILLDNMDFRPKKVLENLYCIPASGELRKFERQYEHKFDTAVPYDLLDGILEKARESADFILIDTNPYISHIVALNALVASDYVVIPTEASTDGNLGVAQLKKLIKGINNRMNPDLSIAGILLTDVEANTKVDREVIKEMREIYKTELFNTVIRKNTDIKNLSTNGIPLTQYAKYKQKRDNLSKLPLVNGIEDYKAFTEELLKRVTL